MLSYNIHREPAALALGSPRTLTHAASAVGSLLFLLAVACSSANADEWELMKTHCGKCHLKAEPEGDFNLRTLASCERWSRL